MDPLELARWQFGITTVYHFMMVPLTLGLGAIVAGLYIAYVRTQKAQYKRMTKFWGKLYLINFIMGVATGLVQEFQFGMAWSEYSRFVGDVFGAPLAMEGLLAFFVESTFLGLFIFGWDKLAPKVHAACLAIAVGASWLSAYFIIVANSWMQHPVGVEMIDGRPVMTDVWAVLTNNTALVAYPHAIFGALQVAGGFLVGISWYKLWKRRKEGIDTIGQDGKVIVGERAQGAQDKTDFTVWFTSLRLGAIVGLIAFLGTGITGHHQAQLMIEQQPMKMAAAEAACHDGTGFSLLSLSSPGAQDCDQVQAVIEIPGLLSFLAYNNFTTDVAGITTLLPEYQETYGTNLPDNPELYGERAGSEIQYLPLMEVTYYGFRGMITLGGISALSFLYVLWVTRKKGEGTVPEARWISNLAIAGILAPFGANATGWIFTEMGRQPFVVAPNPEGNPAVMMFTAAAVSPGVSGYEILFSLISLGLIYGALMVVEVYLLAKYVKAGVVAAMPELVEDPHQTDQKKDRDVLAFAY
ncbi:MAG: cytochrome ubiquinol oxidase subunit I [Rothia sp. (in: high G+C Gram-positive bacteria)]|nr:cytochrome ubiquinol oxidase subunit I [Rothia sp. (in: high G+C Gram-positive bacteria)]